MAYKVPILHIKELEVLESELLSHLDMAREPPHRCLAGSRGERSVQTYSEELAA